MKYDVVIIGGGHSGLEKGMEALRAGKSCCALCKGVSSRKFRDESYRHEAAREEFRSLGGELLMGETVTGGVISDGLLMSVHTESHPDTPIEASVFYLSTGSFFTGGLASTQFRIFEPIFGLDLFATGSHSDWVNPDFFAHQPFMDFGVLTDGEGHALKGGRPILNLFPAGSVLAK